MLGALISTGTVILFVSTIVVVGGVCFFIGRLSARTTVLEHLVEGHYKTITDTIGKLEQNVGKMLSDFTSLRQDINDLVQEIQKRWPKGE